MEWNGMEWIKWNGMEWKCLAGLSARAPHFGWTQFSAISTGVVVASTSLPYRHSPSLQAQRVARTQADGRDWAAPTGRAKLSFHLAQAGDFKPSSPA